jgi:hypothetical protein
VRLRRDLKEHAHVEVNAGIHPPDRDEPNLLTSSRVEGASKEKVNFRTQHKSERREGVKGPKGVSPTRSEADAINSPSTSDGHLI